ncbi:MAG: CHAT domain-containing protein, partial [Cyanobacteria bacterium P01_F01_bin.116]
WPQNSVNVHAAEPQLAAALTQGKALYEAGQLTRAADVLEDVLRWSQGDALVDAIALGNLALVYGQQGNWSAAQQSITRSQQILGPQPTTQEQWSVYAQTLNIQARLQLAQNNAAAALDTWGQAAEAYTTAGDDYRVALSRIRQARALQAQGFYLRAEKILLDLDQQLEKQPASKAKALSLRSLAEALQVTDSLKAAKEKAESAVLVAENLENANELAASQLTLANIIYAQVQASLSLRDKAAKEADFKEVLALYNQVIDKGDEVNRFRAQLNQLSILVKTNPSDALALWENNIKPEVDTLPANRTGIYARINLAQNLSILVESNGSASLSWQTVLKILETAEKQANSLEDQRASAYVTGYIGNIYKRTGHSSEAKQWTEQALLTASAINAADITYRWYEQLGDLQIEQGNRRGAISAYTGAVNTLKTLRTDLVSINPEVQFSFKESIEPVHRKLVGLLLDSVDEATTETTKQQQLKSARNILESLQLEELNNYLRAACLNNQQVAIDEISETEDVAVLYPIILEDRLAIITSLPKQGLVLNEVSVNKTEFESTIIEWRNFLTNRIKLNHKQNGKKLYDWMITPIQAKLAEDKVSTLVFVLDGVLRNTPMAALYDGNQYLIEQYNLAITPGLRLVNPETLQDKSLTSLAFGLTNCADDGCKVTLENGKQREFDNLPTVPDELASIRATLPNTQIIDGETFTSQQFITNLQQTTASIIHLATHGEFSSDPEGTFLLTADGYIDVESFSSTIEANQARSEAIELMVLSACQTASGDPRAALGMAGMAIRSGARSTLASLWSVNDQSTSVLMERFYQALASQELTKAEALRQAQIVTLKDERFRGHPYFWAPFVMIGNWL